MIILFIIYVALVFIAFGVAIETEATDSTLRDFLASVFVFWALVPFLCLIVLGRCLVHIVNKIDE